MSDPKLTTISDQIYVLRFLVLETEYMFHSLTELFIVSLERNRYLSGLEM